MDKRVFADVKFEDKPASLPKDAEMIYATDPASGRGDYTTAVGGYIDNDGTFHLREVSIVRRNPQHRITELRDKLKTRRK